MLKQLLISVPLSAAMAGPACADSLYLGGSDQRAMMADFHPGEFFTDRGEKLFHAKRGPNNKSLEECDFGLGPGVLGGAYAQMPRYFADTDKVMDLESRLLYCMKTIQGFTDADPQIKNKNAPQGGTTDLVDIYTYVAAQSNGYKWDPPMDHPQERLARDAGEQIFYYRTGPMDFSCATCHADKGKRIRLQQLPDIRDRDEMALAISWPAYRASHQTVRGSQHRVSECIWQMRQPPIRFGSDASIAIISYWTDAARGGAIGELPELKR